MKNYLSFLTAAALSVAVLSVSPARGQQKKPIEQEKYTTWMKKKLEVSQNILAGLTEADFDKVRANAEMLNLVNYLEHWHRADMPEYKRQVSYFELANRELIRQASEKNLDGATLAYNQLTVSCVQCHRIVRGAKN